MTRRRAMAQREAFPSHPAACPVEDRRLTQRDLATRWRVSCRSLERWRRDGTGPAWLRLNSRVLYRLEDVLAFEQAHLQRPDR